MPAWPATLPQYVFAQGYEETFPDEVLRTQMDAGPAKVRRRFTAGTRPFSVQVPLTATQVADFDSFFLNDIAAGALSFDWVHPRTQAAATLRIVTPSPPKLAGESGGGSSTFVLSFSFEILP